MSGMSGIGSLPLSRKLPLLVLALLVSVLAITLGVSYYEVRRSAELSAGERLMSLVQVLTTTVDQSVATRITLMRRVARDTAVISALRHATQAPSTAAHHALATLVVTPNDSATPAELWTQDGRRVGSMQLDLPAELQPFRDELRTPQGRKDSVHMSRLTVTNGRASYRQAVPVKDATGHLLGYVVQERRLATNPRTLQPVRDLIGSDIELSLRNRDDDLWVQFSGAPVPAPLGSTVALDSLRLLNRGAAGITLSATRPLAGTPFLITVERPQSHILARPLATIRVLVIIAILLAVVGALVAWLISRRLVRPLKELTSAAESMARGSYDKRVTVGAHDEVGRLGTAFNRMANEVEVSSDASANALERLTRAMQTQEFLAGASSILAGSLSDDQILNDLARYCVPRLGDYCSIHIAEEDGSVRRVETTHHDPSQEERVRTLVRHFAYRVDGPGEVADVIRSQHPILIEQVDVAAVASRVADPAIARLMIEVNPHSFICVPLIARGRGFGAISFTVTGDRRSFTAEDLDIAMELARRASGAIDNAAIYQRSVALRLEAEAASNAKSDFLAKMSHEIRTPINAMMGYAELLQMGISGPVTEVQARQLERIRASGDHLTMLVNEILDLAKIEAGRMDVNATTALARDAVDSALTLIRPLANAKGVELAAPAGGEHVQYVGDPQRVQQIVTNLLSNAVKFTDASGRVMVSCERTQRDGRGRGDWACIRVEDTGRGIGSDDIERIFHPFVQVDSGYTRAQGGTGLGLTISRSLAQLMGGDISVQSRPGTGSAFTLWLPCPKPAQVTA